LHTYHNRNSTLKNNDIIMRSFLKVACAVNVAAIMLLFSCQRNALPIAQKAPDSTALSAAKSKQRTQSTSVYDALMARQADFIKSCMDRGAIKISPISGDGRVCGYFANIACMGLLAQNGSGNVDSVKNWMKWYMARLNKTTNATEVAGSVYDYYSVNGAPFTTNGTYDSVDSYAATFLSLARKLAETNPTQIGWLNSYKPQLDSIGNALLLCIDNSSYTVTGGFSPENNNGLTIDKRTHNVKYVEDNSESYQGLVDMAWLQTNVFTGGNASTYSGPAATLKSNFKGATWNNTAGVYKIYEGYSTPIVLTNFYADAQCQVFPAMFDLVSADSLRSNTVWDKFNANFPNWSTGTYFVVGGLNEPSSIMAYAASKMSDVERCTNYLNWMNTFTGSSQPNYWNCSEAASVILTASYIKNLPTNLALGRPVTVKSTAGGYPVYITDGKRSTRWSSTNNNDEWAAVELTTAGNTVAVSKIVVQWEDAYDPTYKIQTSTDGVNYTDRVTVAAGDGGRDVFTIPTVYARFVRVWCSTHATPYGSSIWELEVY
jgi:hypothetical protein